MAVLTGVSVLAGAAPLLFIINADIQAAGLGAALVMSALAGFLVSIAGGALTQAGLRIYVPKLPLGVQYTQRCLLLFS